MRDVFFGLFTRNIECNLSLVTDDELFNSFAKFNNSLYLDKGSLSAIL